MGRLSLKTIMSHRATLAAIGMVVIVGALLRFHNLDGESIWFDEAASWIQAKDSLADLIKRTAHDNYPPLHNLALFAAIKLFGDSEWSLRLPSVIFGVANIVALYWLGAMTVGRVAGLIGAVLLALSPFHLWYSQEARMYSLLALAATLYAATCFHYLRAPSLPRGAWVSLAGLALVYSHPYGTLDWITIAVAFAVFVLRFTSPPPRTILVWNGSNVVIAAGFAPWAPILAHRAHVLGDIGLFPPTISTFMFIVNNLQQFLGGRLFVGVIFIGVVLGIVGRLRSDVAVLCVWIVAPVAIGVLLMHVFIWRYAIGSLPPLLLLSAFGWTKYAKDWQVPILSMAIVAIAGLTLLWHHHPNSKDDWRGVASFLDEREQPADCVLIVPALEAAALDYYRRNSTCQWGATTLADLPAEMPASVLFGVFHPWGMAPPDSAAYVEELRRRGWRDLDRTDFRGVQVVTFSR
jgi:mannosyltransferase